MLLDTHTASFVSAAITTVTCLTVLVYSLARTENRPFIWAATASGGFAVAQFLFGFRGEIPVFFSIVCANSLCTFCLVAFHEAIQKLVQVPSPQKHLGPVVLAVQIVLILYYTYYIPDFSIRVVVMSSALGIMSVSILKLILLNLPEKQRFFYIFSTIPFFLLLSMSILRTTLFLFAKELLGSSYNSQAFAISLLFYGVFAVWVTLSLVFIVSSRVQDQLSEMALTDPLTGSFNRRAFGDLLRREIARAKRTDSSLSLIITDLDHFKKVNDTFGHQAGDAILAHIVLLYKNLLRANDILARYGGEEFVVVLPGADLSMASSVAERLREACRRNPLVYNGQPIPVTSSFGVVSFSKNIYDFDSIVKQADNALYKAKEEGRDKVVLFEGK